MTTATDTALADVQIAFIGAGVMAESMISGLLDKGIVGTGQVVASHPRADRRQQLRERHGIRTVETNVEAVQAADLVFLTIKPQVLSQVIGELKGRFSSNQVVVSILAGASLGVLRRGLGHDAVIRVMPNTPAQIGEGMSVWCGTSDVSDERRMQVRAALAALGKEIEVDTEKYVDLATALSGTGPTYVFINSPALH